MDQQQKVPFPYSEERLKQSIRSWGQELGFQQVGFSDIQLDEAESRLHNWLQQGMHGEMGFMAKHGSKRSHPAELVEATCSIISVRMDYQPEAMNGALQLLEQSDKAYISRYALGRDYHKLMRNRLQKLYERIAAEYGPFGYRVFVDSAPVLEKAIAEKAGLGWIGKHSNLIQQQNGSWFFLGEIYTNLPLTADEKTVNHCGTCTACMDACPTAAIVAPYVVDARRCISYLSIELHGAIPVEFRKAMGNRIYGCDDCQLVCPWNRFAELSQEGDFQARHNLDDVSLVELFAWSEEQFLQRLQGSPIRRIGHERWLRNIAVALGNIEDSTVSQADIIHALESRANHPSALVREHVTWALLEHGAQAPTTT